MISLTTRLTLLFVLVSVAIFTVLGFMIQHSLSNHFATQDFSELGDKIKATVRLLERTQRSDSATAIALSIEEAIVDHDSIIVRIDTADGDNLFSISPITVPYNVENLLLKPGQAERREWQQGEIAYRGLAMATPGGTAGSPALIISTAMETTRHAAFMDNFSSKLVGLMIVATMLSALLGWWVSRQGLAPLRSMGAKAKSVTAKRLDQRLAVESLPVELGALAIELNLMLDRLQESFNRLTHFSSDIAHELRTPISNLVMQTQVSLAAPHTEQELEDVLYSNLEEFERLSRMTSDMLFLAKAENSMKLPSSERFKLEDEIIKLFDFYEALADERSLTLRMQGGGELAGDRIMIDRAISNLLSNAIRHTPENGQIDVEIEHRPDVLQVQIKNTGTPIADSELPYLFDRFYRCDRSRCNTDHEGTGLGLSITRAIVKAHGGSIEVHSDKNNTCFTLIFPEQERA
ncbi:heavy metal sensor histidine kinase [Marinobacterium mangrovicola]|nr:heavy metal sensor histidine kinase [Marinobacterium mangrovicola]